MTNITQLVRPELKRNHQRLVDALGSENNPSQWMIFMETCEELIPTVMTSGRPTEKSIQSSMIGQLGFDSWKAMIEAPTNQNGLGWKWEGWRSFRRAWTVVSKNPYLKDMDLKAGWINSAVASIKRNGDEFPATREDFDIYQQQESERAKTRKENSVVGLKQEIMDLKSQINTLQQDLAKQTGMTEILKQNNHDLNVKNTEMTQMLGDTEKRLKYIKKQPEKKISRWQHFKAIFTGRI